MNTNESKNVKEQGQSLVELAISLVVLLILLAGLVDLGRAFFTYITLRDAAQEGASYASVSDSDAVGNVADYCQAITDRVLITTTTFGGGGDSNGPVNLAELHAAGDVQITTLVNGTNCSSVPVADICLGGAVSVEVEYANFPLTMPFMGSILGSQSFPISAVVVDTILTPACE